MMIGENKCSSYTVLILYSVIRVDTLVSFLLGLDEQGKIFAGAEKSEGPSQLTADPSYVN